jgi:hypothetical protein
MTITANWRTLCEQDDVNANPKLKITKAALIGNQYWGIRGKKKRSDPPAMNAVIARRTTLRNDWGS